MLRDSKKENPALDIPLELSSSRLTLTDQTSPYAVYISQREIAEENDPRKYHRAKSPNPKRPKLIPLESSLSDPQIFVINVEDRAPSHKILHEAIRGKPDWGISDWSDRICASLQPFAAKTRTRLVFVNLPMGYMSLKSECTKALMAIFGVGFNIEPSFFASLDGDIDMNLQSEETGYLGLHFPTGKTLPGFQFTELTFSTKDTRYQVGPRVSIKIVSKGEGQSDHNLNTVIVFLVPPFNLHYGTGTGRLEVSLPIYKSRQTLDRDSMMSNPQLHHGDAVIYSLKALTRFTLSQINSANKNPIEFVSPIWEIFKGYQQYCMNQLRKDHHAWLLKNDRSATDDKILYQRWISGRALIEEFETLATTYHYFKELQTINPATQPTKDEIFTNKVISSSRALEKYIRDTLQLNVGNLSLQESRKSLAQADGIGRISFLAFLFLPLSLVTSFFGMNIKQMTGSGVSWKIFFAGAGTMIGLTAMGFAYLWRKSLLRVWNKLWVNWLWGKYLGRVMIWLGRSIEALLAAVALLVLMPAIRLSLKFRSLNGLSARVIDFIQGWMRDSNAEAGTEWILKILGLRFVFRFYKRYDRNRDT